MSEKSAEEMFPEIARQTKYSKTRPAPKKKQSEALEKVFGQKGLEVDPRTLEIKRSPVPELKKDALNERIAKMQKKGYFNFGKISDCLF